MPTILRFRGFNIAIFVDDHEPAHVHVIGKDSYAIFILQCPSGPVRLRETAGIKLADLRAIEAFLNDNLIILCERWREIDDQRTGTSRS